MADCPPPNDYVWTGVPPNDEAAPFCAVYTPAKDTFALLNAFEWFWQESNCDRQYPALCEIDLRETGCQVSLDIFKMGLKGQFVSELFSS